MGKQLNSSDVSMVLSWVRCGPRTRGSNYYLSYVSDSRL